MQDLPGEVYTLSDFQKIEKIGEGTYGVVYKSKNRWTNRFVAIKKIRLENEEEGLPSTAIRETSLLVELKHANIVVLEHVLLENGKLHLVFEYLSMDLKKYMDSFQDAPMPPHVVQSFCFQMLQAVLFCHQRRILHRDLKPQNLLVDLGSGVAPDGAATTPQIHQPVPTLKLADFGLSRTFSVPINHRLTHEVVTLYYRAPEILLGARGYSVSVDVWSIGTVLAEMAIKKPVFQGDSEIGQLFRIFSILGTPTDSEWPGVESLPQYKVTFPVWRTNRLAEVIAGRLDDTGIDLLKAIFAYNPAKRISCRGAIGHPYFDGLDLESLPAPPPSPPRKLQNRVVNIPTQPPPSAN